MTQLQSDEKHNSFINKTGTKTFANFWAGMLFLTSSISLIIVMSMFVFIWQPIWTEGFKDFHTISTAIDQLDKTAQPASDAIPLMLVEISQMNKHMYEINKHMYELYKMKNIMGNMGVSMGNIEEMTPNIKRMAHSIEKMTTVLSTEMPRMTYLMGKVDNKMPNMDFMPFN